MRIKLKRMNNRGVIYIWAVTILALFAVGLMWFLLDNLVSPLFNAQKASYPVEMSGGEITFMYAIWTYWPVLAIFGIGIWVYVSSQKQRQAEQQL